MCERGVCREAGGNSLHRHALVGSGDFRIAARSPDRIIEAFEV
jgi:gamma-glutamyl-gamma-aminobutyrate hydrolase PuuD